MKVFKSLKKIELNDIKSIILLLLAYIPSLFLRFKKKNIWCIVERINSADDNGWIFYQWLKSNHPERYFYFILNNKVDNYDKNDHHMVSWGSLSHYIVYLASDIHIKTTFMTPQPNIRVCSYYEHFFKKNFKTVYLRHGISKDGLELHRYPVQKVRLFICGAKPEYDYINTYGEYPLGYVQYTGLARFDQLINKCTFKRYILLLPTWRRYLHDPFKTQKENETIFLQSNYYKTYNSFINNKELNHFLDKNNLRIIYCTHPEFDRYNHLFTHNNQNVIVVKSNEISIHQLLLETGLLITDYSSVFFDIAYMLKPMVYYHFDYDEFRKKHFLEGYFSYVRDGMGQIVNTERDLIQTIMKLYNGATFINPDEYKKRCMLFFPKRDSHNCERIYNEILKIES